MGVFSNQGKDVVAAEERCKKGFEPNVAGYAGYLEM